MNVHYSSKTDEWSTPQALFDDLNIEFGFGLDACATPENAKCRVFFQRDENALAQDWRVGGAVFMNPPYGRAIGKWVEKAYNESLFGITVVCLLPARTDTSWWHEFVMKGEIRFLRGRLKFGESKNSAPFPSTIVIFRGQK